MLSYNNNIIIHCYYLSCILCYYLIKVEFLNVVLYRLQYNCPSSSIVHITLSIDLNLYTIVFFKIYFHLIHNVRY